MDRRVFACITLVFTIVSANYHSLKFKDNGKEYTEVVKTDKKQNTVELQVPGHGSSGPLGVLNDFSTGFSAKKDYENNVCYISKIEKDFPKPDQVDKNMQMSNSFTDSDQYKVSNVKIQPIRNMAKHEVGPKISAFCYGYKMVLVAENEKETDDKESGKQAKSDDDEDALMKRGCRWYRWCYIIRVCYRGICYIRYRCVLRLMC